MPTWFLDHFWPFFCTFWGRFMGRLCRIKPKNNNRFLNRVFFWFINRLLNPNFSVKKNQVFFHWKKLFFPFGDCVFEPISFLSLWVHFSPKLRFQFCFCKTFREFCNTSKLLPCVSSEQKVWRCLKHLCDFWTFSLLDWFYIRRRVFLFKLVFFWGVGV